MFIRKEVYRVKDRINICHVVNNLDMNGISKVILNYCEYIDKKTFNMSVVAGAPINDDILEVLKKNDIKVYQLPSRKKESSSFYKELYSILKYDHFDILHVHGNSSTMAIELFIAHISGIKSTIAHCHASKSDNMVRHKALMPLFKHLYSKGIACSELAGEWIFGKDNFEVVLNGFDIQEFIFSENKRHIYRKKLGIDGKTVIGHVGRFNKYKNQKYLLEVFKLIYSCNKDIVLLLVGNGPDYLEIRDDVLSKPYANNVIFYGETTDVSGLLSAMDIFLMPSTREGLGIVALEAQISGLPCLVSDTLPQDVKLSENIRFLSIDEKDIENWKNSVLETSIKTEMRKLFCEKNLHTLSRFDIYSNIKQLEQIYQGLFSSSCMNSK